MFFWWLNLVRLYSLYKILYPKRRIESYSIMGTIVSQKKYYSYEIAPELFRRGYAGDYIGESDRGYEGGG